MRLRLVRRTVEPGTAIATRSGEVNRMRIARITVGTAMAMSLALAPLEAAPKGKGPAPVKVSAPKAPKAAPSPKTTKTTAKAPKAPKTTTAAKGSGAPKTKATTTSQTKLAKAETRSTKKFGTASAITSPTTTPTPPTAIDFTKGKAGEKLTKNTKMAQKLGTRLTALGYTGSVFEAAYGFKNFGQFNAAVNNAQNHGLSFEQLKTQMTGVSVSPTGVVLYANLNPNGTVTMVPLAQLTNPAPTTSLGQAKKTLATTAVPPVLPVPLVTTTAAAVRVTR
jgi:hypothetical protein